MKGIFRFVIKRILYGIMTLWTVSTITFFMLHSLPGDPFTSERAVPKAVKQKLLKEYNMDKPLYVQYFMHMKKLAKGDLGISMKYRGRKVKDIIGNSFVYSIDLSLRAILFALTFGLIIGIFSAIRRGKFVDKSLILIAVVGISVPSFVFSGLLQIIFSNWLKILPAGRYISFKHTILPTIALGIGPMAVIARMTRASFIEVLSQDYIKTARAKGLSEKRIIFHHALRNAIMPVIGYLGQIFAATATGSFVIERIFVIPGLGNAYVESIQDQDYTMVLGLKTFYAMTLILSLVAVDILYAIINPNISLNSNKLRTRSRKG